MDIGRIRFDDPRHLGEPSNTFVDAMMRFERLDYARRYFERVCDKSSVEKAKETRKLYKQTILDSVHIVRSLIPQEVMNEHYRARKDYQEAK